MAKDQFKNPKARYSGNDLFQQDADLTNSFDEEANYRYSEEPKTHSFTILPSYIEQMRNYVHFRKMNGDPYFTQGELIQAALDNFFGKLDTPIPERPIQVKRAEKKKTGRRKSTSTLKDSSDDIGF